MWGTNNANDEVRPTTGKQVMPEKTSVLSVGKKRYKYAGIVLLSVLLLQIDQVKMVLQRFLLLLTAALTSASALVPRDASDPLASCPGYKASNVKTTSSGLTADLTLAGKACNAYGNDLTQLKLEVTYETGRSQVSYATISYGSAHNLQILGYGSRRLTLDRGTAARKDSRCSK